MQELAEYKGFAAEDDQPNDYYDGQYTDMSYPESHGMAPVDQSNQR